MKHQTPGPRPHQALREPTDAWRPAEPERAWRAERHAPRRLGGVWLLAAVTLVVALSGASCPQIVQRYTRPLPRALPASPTLAQIIEVVNGNSQRIQAFSTTRGSISVAGFPALRASMAYQRDKNFRLRGETAITGPEVDVGSNSQEFWFWVRRAPPPALYYCAHDRYATSSARQIIPVDPNWLIEALGVVTFDPTWRHTGPSSLGGGRVEIRSEQSATTSLDPLRRIVVLDELRGIVLEQHLYNSSNQRIATAKLSKHLHDPTTGVTMPRRVEIEWPSTQFRITIDLTDLQINQVGGDPRQLFTRPQYPGYQDIDLASGEVGPAAPPTGMPGQPTPAMPNAAMPNGSMPGAAMPTTGYPTAGYPAAGMPMAPGAMPATSTTTPISPADAWQSKPAYQVSPQPTLATPPAGAPTYGTPTYAPPAYAPPAGAAPAYSAPGYPPQGAYAPPGAYPPAGAYAAPSAYSPPPRAAQSPSAYGAGRSPSY